MKKLFFLIIPFFLFLHSEKAEAQSRRLERADQAFENRQYNEALELYRKAYRRVQRKDRREGVRILFRQAMCNMYLNEPRRAESLFRRAIRGNYPDPIAIFYYAETLMQNQKYEDALQQFTLYKEKAPDDWRGQRGIEAVRVAQELLETPGLYEVELPRNFNSRADDFTPAFGDHRSSILIFTSSRDGALGSKKDPWTGKNFTSLFVSFEDRRGEWSSPVLLDEGPVNTEFNEGAPSVNASGTELYFTRCYSVPDLDMGCRIFNSTRQGANWGEPREVPLVTDSAISVGHPAISPDEMRLYFVSDMPGGHGGKDIWYAERQSPGGEFKNPVNLGPLINTPGDEMFPYVREDGTLYFSSNGHPGLGGLDIFFSKMGGNSWTNPENMGTPVNSSADDFGIVFKKGTESGYFSSNRSERGARGDAIFSLYLAPVEFTLSGTVRDDSTKRILPGAQVQLIGSDGSFTQAETDDKGEFLFDKEKVKQNTSYQILVSKEKYFNERGQETTVGIVRSRDFVYDFYLAPIPYTPIELPEILYDFASWELLPQYQDSLNGLIRTLQDNPSITVELASHTDSRGTDAFNDTLSQRRAQSVVNYLIERGIDSRRLVASGYGKRVPRTIEKTIVRDGFTFEAGTVLNESYIRNLPTEMHRDAAHQLNRRTEFRVLSDDFSPGQQQDGQPPGQIQIRGGGNRSDR
jgi:peptidoglycan-associated lipoprotein